MVQCTTQEAVRKLISFATENPGITCYKQMLSGGSRFESLYVRYTVPGAAYWSGSDLRGITASERTAFKSNGSTHLSYYSDLDFSPD